MYLVDGRRYEPNEHGLKRALAAAYDGRIRPLCLCSDPPIPVYITRLGGTFVLKRMPFTGSQHGVGCPHYEPPAELGGLGEMLGTAILEDPDTGLTRLRVGFALSKGFQDRFPSDCRHERHVVENVGAQLSLRGLAHFLWREAELSRWRPAFDGRRSWAVVRHHLLAAAVNKVLNRSLLEDLLFIPETFSVADADALRTRRSQFLSSGVAKQHKSGSKMILIGELKQVVPKRNHFEVVIKHLPDLPFQLTTKLHRQLTQQFEDELALRRNCPDTHLIIAATFLPSEWNQPVIDKLSLVLTSAQWLPVDDCFEKQLIDRLVRERRAFIKSLGFNSKLTPGAISVVPIDSASAPLPIRPRSHLPQAAWPLRSLADERLEMPVPDPNPFS